MPPQREKNQNLKYKPVARKLSKDYDFEAAFSGENNSGGRRSIVTTRRISSSALLPNSDITDGRTPLQLLSKRHIQLIAIICSLFILFTVYGGDWSGGGGGGDSLTVVDAGTAAAVDKPSFSSSKKSSSDRTSLDKAVVDGGADNSPIVDPLSGAGENVDEPVPLLKTMLSTTTSSSTITTTTTTTTKAASSDAKSAANTTSTSPTTTTAAAAKTIAPASNSTSTDATPASEHKKTSTTTSTPTTKSDEEIIEIATNSTEPLNSTSASPPIKSLSSVETGPNKANGQPESDPVAIDPMLDPFNN